MTKYEQELKKRDMEDFCNVIALYTALKHDTSNLRIKQAVYRADEVKAQPLDYVIDVELKARRLLGQPIYELFLRSVYNDNLELLPEYTREALGREWISYGLGPEGTYRRIYYTVKNEQVRNFLKERDRGAIAKFDRSTGLDGELASDTTGETY